MNNTPSDAEIRGLAAEGNGVYQDDETAVWEITDPSLIKFARAVLAKWGTVGEPVGVLYVDRFTTQLKALPGANDVRPIWVSHAIHHH